MTDLATPAEVSGFDTVSFGVDRGSASWRNLTAWIPSLGLIAAKHLELRRRRGLILVVALFTVGFPVLVLGIRLLFHAVDPKGYGPAGSPSVFQSLCNPMGEFGFIVAATLGTAAGTTDLTDGVFRHLVVTGRSRVALYLARIPAGLSIILPLVALAFTIICVVTSYAGVAQPTTLSNDGVSIPLHMTESQFDHYVLTHPNAAALALGPGQGKVTRGDVAGAIKAQPASLYESYLANEASSLNPPINEMVKIGLWLELEIGIGFMVGLGLGSLIGQRTVSTIMMIALEIIITPLLASTTIPYFLNGQRVVVGIALDQLRPAGLAAGVGGGPGHGIFGGRGALNIAPMPTWAMVTVIVGWIVGWSVIGAWRMATRDA